MKNKNVMMKMMKQIEEQQVKYKYCMDSKFSGREMAAPYFWVHFGKAMKSFWLLLFFASCTLLATAQLKLTLKDAIEMGIRNNMDVLQSDLQMKEAGIHLKQSRENQLPNLNASANYGTNFGRNIDPFTNAFINQKVNFSGLGASSNVLLFNGFSLHNQIKSDRLGFEASKMELQQAKDNLTMNIILAYLQILSAQDALQQSLEQDSVTQKQVDRLSILNGAGSISPSQYYSVKGQLAGDKIAIVNNRSALANAKLQLAQLLNIPYDENMEVERMKAEDFKISGAHTPGEIYQTALQEFAEVKAVKLRTESAEKNIRSIKGQMFPRLSLGGNINTNYSSVATRDYFVNTTEEPSSNYVTVGGTQYPVVTKQSHFNTENITFGNQLNNNLGYTVSLGLAIPLFNAGQTRNQIKLAGIGLKRNELVEKNTKTRLQQSIEQAYVNFTSATAKYNLLQGQVNSFTESFREAEIKFNSGAITSVDYLIAKNNLDRTKNNLIMARYDIVLRKKVLDYYGGISLWSEK